MHQLIRLSNHSSIYRGFTITKLPRNSINRFKRYRVIQNDQSFGLFDAQPLATDFIDELYQKRELTQ